MKPKYLLIFAVIAITCAACSRSEDPVQKENYGVTNEGESVDIFTLTNSKGASTRITNYGAIVQSLYMPDRDGNFADIVLGYDSLKEYIDHNPYFGAIVGRFGNRIKGGKFTLDGNEFQLDVNEGNNHLHGGSEGFHTKVWEAEKLKTAAGPALKLTYLSPDMEMGYPGNLTISVTYTLTDENELKIDYEATTDRATILNPTHHSYFNLSGDMNKTILDHELMMDAEYFTPIDNTLIPTGEIKSVGNTPMDFKEPVKIGARIDEDYAQLKFAGGYDHNWVLSDYDGGLRKVASLYDEESGRLMEIYTDQPGLQFYSGNFLDGTITGKGGTVYEYRTGLCLEAQHFPNSPNEEAFPSVVLNPGEIYKQTTIYKFSVR